MLAILDSHQGNSFCLSSRPIVVELTIKVMSCDKLQTGDIRSAALPTTSVRALLPPVQQNLAGGDDQNIGYHICVFQGKRWQCLSPAGCFQKSFGNRENRGVINGSPRAKMLCNWQQVYSVNRRSSFSYRAHCFFPMTRQAKISGHRWSNNMDYRDVYGLY